MAKAAGQAEATTVTSQASKTTAAEVAQAAATQGEKMAATQAAQAASKPATAVVLTEAEIAAVAADVEAQVLAEAQVAAEAAAARNQAATQATKAPPTQPATPATQAQPAAKPVTQPATKPATTLPQQTTEAATEAELAAATVVASDEVIAGSAVNNTVPKLQTNLNNLGENSINHIIEGSRNSDHKWRFLVKDDKDWQSIKAILEEVIQTGVDGIYKNGPCKRKIINGYLVEVPYREIDGIIKVGNGWVQ